MKLEEKFYLDTNVVKVAQKLLGKALCTFINGQYTSGLICETEAYAGVTDKASHAWNGRHTPRTSIMFGKGGVAYVYLCYGIHHLFNVVTNVEGTPHAVLIRGIIPLEGKELMQERLQKKKLPHALYGPGLISKALGITTGITGASLSGDLIWIEERGEKPAKAAIEITPRIGIDYAGEDAKLPYRFVWKP